MGSSGDVRHDAAAAGAAAAQLRGVAADLEQILGRRRELAAAALDRWSGAHREAIAPEIERELRVTGELITELRACAARVDAATTAAADEQRRRERVREAEAAEQRRRSRIGGPR